MPICQQCHQKWTFMQTLKKTTTLNPALTCPYCGKTQYQTQKSKTKIGILNLFILSPLLIQAFFDVTVLFLISMIVILALAVISIYPFLVELSDEEQFPF